MNHEPVQKELARKVEEQAKISEPLLDEHYSDSLEI